MSTFPKLQGILFIVLASVLWSTSGFFAKSPQLEAWPIEERGVVLSFWRALFALTLMVPWIRRPRFAWGMIPMALLFAAMNWSYLTALVTGPPANAIWLQNLAPVWVMVFSVFVLKEKAIARDWWMLSFSASGVLFILLFQFANQSVTSHLSAILAVLSGIFYAGVILCLRMLRNEDSAWLIAFNHLATALVMAPWALSNARYPEGTTWLMFAAFGMFQMGLPYLLFARGLRTTPGPIASVLTLLEPILLPIWIHLAWRNAPGYEPPAWWTLVGGGFILVGLLIRFVPWRGRRGP